MLNIPQLQSAQERAKTRPWESEQELPNADPSTAPMTQTSSLDYLQTSTRLYTLPCSLPCDLLVLNIIQPRHKA